LMQCAASVLVSPDFSNIFFGIIFLIINMNNQIVLELPIILEFYNFYIQIIIISFLKKKYTSIHNKFSEIINSKWIWWRKLCFSSISLLFWWMF
jgi:hypothetical protein